MVAVDRPGYGGSGEDPLSIPDQIDAYAALLRERAAHSAAPALVVGHSYGAVPAAGLAARHPELVGALGLLAPALRDDDRELPPGFDGLAKLMVKPAVGEFLKATLLSQAGRTLIAKVTDPMSFHPDEVDPDHLAGVRDRTLQWNAFRSFWLEARAMRRESAEVESHLGALHVPAAVIHAPGDRVVDPAAGFRTAASIPRCTHHETGGGHMLTISRADEVAELLLQLADRAEVFAAG